MTNQPNYPNDDVPEGATTSTDMMDEFHAVADRILQLRDNKTDLKQQLSSIEIEMKQLEYQAHNFLVTTRQPSLAHNGQRFSVARTLSIRAKYGLPNLAQVMVEHEVRDLLTVNNSTLASMCREMMFDETTDTWELHKQDQLPSYLRDQIDVAEVSQLRVRKA